METPKPPAFPARQRVDLHVLRPGIDVYIDRFIGVSSLTTILVAGSRYWSDVECLLQFPR